MLEAIRYLKVAAMYSVSWQEVKINSSYVKILKNKTVAWFNKSFYTSFSLLPTQQQMIHINNCDKNSQCTWPVLHNTPRTEKNYSSQHRVCCKKVHPIRQRESGNFPGAEI